MRLGLLWPGLNGARPPRALYNLFVSKILQFRKRHVRPAIGSSEKTIRPECLPGVRFPLRTNRPLLTICNAGKVIQLAAEQLKERGIDAYPMPNGMKSWSLFWNTAEASIVSVQPWFRCAGQAKDSLVFDYQGRFQTNRSSNESNHLSSDTSKLLFSLDAALCGAR